VLASGFAGIGERRVASAVTSPAGCCCPPACKVVDDNAGFADTWGRPLTIGLFAILFMKLRINLSSRVLLMLLLFFSSHDGGDGVLGSIAVTFFVVALSVRMRSCLKKTVD
jgi:hypothetical protein